MGNKSVKWMHKHCTLTKNSDGTPVKQWREVTAKELLLEGFSEVPLPCQVRDREGEEWRDDELAGVRIDTFGFMASSSCSWDQCRIEAKP